jgi:hypothetical protein
MAYENRHNTAATTGATDLVTDSVLPPTPVGVVDARQMTVQVRMDVSDQSMPPPGDAVRARTPVVRGQKNPISSVDA